TPTTVGTANEQGFLTDIKSLTAPAMEGRGAGTKGLTRAAHLIEQRYKSLGLQPTGKNGFFQPLDVITGAQLRPGNELAKYVQGGGQLRTYPACRIGDQSDQCPQSRGESHHLFEWNSGCRGRRSLASLRNLRRTHRCWHPLSASEEQGCLFLAPCRRPVRN